MKSWNPIAGRHSTDDWLASSRLPSTSGNESPFAVPRGAAPGAPRANTKTLNMELLENQLSLRILRRRRCQKGKRLCPRMLLEVESLSDDKLIFMGKLFRKKPRRTLTLVIRRVLSVIVMATPRSQVPQSTTHAFGVATRRLAIFVT